MDLGPIEQVIELLAKEGDGITIRPVWQGMRIGGFGSQDTYDFDGWEVGYINPNTGGEIAVGRTIEEAVRAALDVLERGRG